MIPKGTLLITGLALFNIVDAVINHQILKLHNLIELPFNHHIGNLTFLSASVAMLILGYVIVNNIRNRSEIPDIRR